jgi:hypothetical protein
MLTRIKAELETFASRNQGTYPFLTGGTGGGQWSDFYSRYIQSSGVNVVDPSTGTDVLHASPGTSPSSSGFNLVDFDPSVMGGGNLSGLPGQAGAFEIVLGAKCSGESLAASGAANGVHTKSYVVVIGLDRAGTRYCIDNG